METFSELMALCVGNSPVTDEFPLQRPVTWSFDALFDLCLNKRSCKQSRRRWFETPSPHHDVTVMRENPIAFPATLEFRTVLLLRPDAVASLSTNSNTVFKWKLHCHWLIGLRQHQIAIITQGPGQPTFSSTDDIQSCRIVIAGWCTHVTWHHWPYLDSFTVPLHSPNGTHLSLGLCKGTVSGLWKSGRNFHWSREPIIHCDTRHSKSIFRPTTHKRVMLAKPRPCTSHTPLTVLLPPDYDCVLV